MLQVSIQIKKMSRLRRLKIKKLLELNILTGFTLEFQSLLPVYPFFIKA